MAQYINKSALVAEINSRININETCQKISGGHEFYRGSIDEAKEILSLLDTFEVKEVDLEKVFLDEYSKFSNDVDAMDYAFPIDLADYKDFAKHFFELGVQVNNPITAADRCTAEEIIVNLKRVEQDYRIDLTNEIEWLRNKIKK